MIILGITSSSDKNVPAAPTIGTATNVGTGRAYNNGAATVTFTPNYSGGLPITSYTATSSPGGFTASGSASPLTVTGLQSGVAYTFTVTATNSVGTSAASAASNSITATTVPQAPTIGTASDGGTGTSVSVAFTAGATGGSAITTFTATSSPGSITGTAASSPITVSGLTTGQAYTFTVTATNANGTSTASAASNSVTPVAPVNPMFESIASATGTGSANIITFNNIPQTYRNLQFRLNASSTSSGNGFSYMFIRINTNTSAYYAIYCEGLTSWTNYFDANTASSTTGYAAYATDTNRLAQTIVDITNYTNTTQRWGYRFIAGYGVENNSLVSFGNGSQNTSTGAITRIDFVLASGNFGTKTEIAMYGIKDA